MNNNFHSDIRYLDELEEVMVKYELDAKDICLLSSSSLAIRNKMNNNDIEFALEPNARTRLLEKYNAELQINEFSGVIRFGENIECDLNSYKTMGIDDSQLFQDTYSSRWNEFRVINLEVYIAQLYIQNREKDEERIQLLSKNGILTNEFQEKVKALLYVAISNGYEIYGEKREVIWNGIFTQTRPIYIFGVGNIGKHVYFKVRREYLIEKLTGFAVSGKSSNIQSFMDKPVKLLDEIIVENPIVIVAVSINNMIETMSLLSAHGIKDIYSGFQFWIKE